MNVDLTLSQFETDINNKIIDLYRTMSKLYNDINAQYLQVQPYKYIFDHFEVFLVD
jgi:hypothetical protein